MATKLKKKKKTSSKKSSKKSTAKKKDTIISTVVSIFKATPGISSEACVKKIKSKFPSSAFDDSHYTYYRHKVQKEPYNVSLPALKGKKKATKKKTAQKAVAKKSKKKVARKKR